MWSRGVELMFGCWLAVSPFIFAHSSEDTWLWVNDLSVAAIVCTLSLMSFARQMRHAHYGTLLIGVWLVGFGFFGAEPPPPAAYQNHVLIGMLLLMFAILPNDADRPPEAWRAFYQKRESSGNQDG